MNFSFPALNKKSTFTMQNAASISHLFITAIFDEYSKKSLTENNTEKKDMELTRKLIILHFKRCICNNFISVQVGNIRTEFSF